MSVPFDNQYLWIRISPDGAKRLAELQRASADGVIEGKDAELFLALSQMIDYREYCHREDAYPNSAHPYRWGDKWVQRYKRRRVEALKIAEEAWQAQQIATERQIAREQEPD